MVLVYSNPSSSRTHKLYTGSVATATTDWGTAAETTSAGRRKGYQQHPSHSQALWEDAAHLAVGAAVVGVAVVGASAERPRGPNHPQSDSAAASSP